MSNIIKLSSGYDLVEYDELNSTMLTMKEMALAGCDLNKVVTAKRQVKGRGRHGRSWVSPEGNLYFSFLRKSNKNININIFAPVFINTLSVAHSIITISKNKILPSIKWPNDLLVNKRKIAGILIENINISKNNDLLNIGIGINIISNPLNTIYPATNLKKENILTTSYELLDVFFKEYNKIDKIYIDDGIEKIFEMWNDLGHKIGDKISVKVGDKEIKGTFNGLSKEGALLIINEDGQQQSILAGDVFLL